MKRFRFTSKAFQGHILLSYDDSTDLCRAVEFNCELSPAQVDYFTRAFPMRLADLEAIVGRTGRVEAVQADLSFDSFWSTYAVKINRKRAIPLWERLNDAERVAVFSAIPRYRYYCKSKGISMANPENYLRDRRWEDEL